MSQTLPLALFAANASLYDVPLDAPARATLAINAAGTAFEWLQLGEGATANFGLGASDVARGDHTHSFDSLENTPTTLAGYGITDAYNKTQINLQFGLVADALQLNSDELDAVISQLNDLTPADIGAASRYGTPLGEVAIGYGLDGPRMSFKPSFSNSGGPDIVFEGYNRAIFAGAFVRFNSPFFEFAAGAQLTSYDFPMTMTGRRVQLMSSVTNPVMFDGGYDLDTILRPGADTKRVRVEGELEGTKRFALSRLSSTENKRDAVFFDVDVTEPSDASFAADFVLRTAFQGGTTTETLRANAFSARFANGAFQFNYDGTAPRLLGVQQYQNNNTNLQHRFTNQIGAGLTDTLFQIDSAFTALDGVGLLRVKNVAAQTSVLSVIGKANGGGRVGVGTDTPQSAFDVIGAIKSSEIVSAPKFGTSDSYLSFSGDGSIKVVVGIQDRLIFPRLEDGGGVGFIGGSTIGGSAGGINTLGNITLFAVNNYANAVIRGSDGSAKFGGNWYETSVAQHHIVNMSDWPGLLIEGRSGQSAPLLAFYQKSSTQTSRLAATFNALVTQSSDASFTTDVIIQAAAGGSLAPAAYFSVERAAFPSSLSSGGGTIAGAEVVARNAQVYQVKIGGTFSNAGDIYPGINFGYYGNTPRLFNKSDNLFGGGGTLTIENANLQISDGDLSLLQGHFLNVGGFRMFDDSSAAHIDSFGTNALYFAGWSLMSVPGAALYPSAWDITAAATFYQDVRVATGKKIYFESNGTGNVIYRDVATGDSIMGTPSGIVKFFNLSGTVPVGADIVAASYNIRRLSSTNTLRNAASFTSGLTNSSDASFTANAVISVAQNGSLLPVATFDSDYVALMRALFTYRNTEYQIKVGDIYTPEDGSLGGIVFGIFNAVQMYRDNAYNLKFYGGNGILGTVLASGGFAGKKFGRGDATGYLFADDDGLFRLMNAAHNNWQSLAVGDLYTYGNTYHYSSNNFYGPIYANAGADITEARIKSYLGYNPALLLRGTDSQTEALLVMQQKSSTGTFRDAASVTGIVTDSSDASFSSAVVLKSARNGEFGRFGHRFSSDLVSLFYDEDYNYSPFTITATGSVTGSVAYFGNYIGAPTFYGTRIVVQNPGSQVEFLNNDTGMTDTTLLRSGAHTVRVGDNNGGRGNIEANSLIGASANGTLWRLTFNDDGTIQVTPFS